MPNGAAHTVLVIDDTPDSLVILRRHLEGWGYRALTASTADQGLVLAQTERPDLILLDMMMPRMNGRELCGLLKANPETKDIPVIFLSALDTPDYIRTGMRLGAEDYVTKPFEPDDLKRHITVCLLRHAGKIPPASSSGRRSS